MSDLEGLVETAEQAPEGARHQAPGPSRVRGRARARHLWEQASRGVASRGDVLAVIAAGGALGSLARWALSVALAGPGDGFPWGTFTANVTGCFLIGALMVLIADVWPPSRYLRPFLGVGVLGGYTTFSSYMLDTRSLLVTGHAATAAAYLSGTLAAGLAAVWLGVTAVRWAVRLARWRARHRAGDHDGNGPAGPTASPSTVRSSR